MIAVVYVRFSTPERAAELLRLMREQLLDIPSVSRFSEDDCGADGQPYNPTVLRLELTDDVLTASTADDLKAVEVYSPGGDTIWPHAA